MTYHPLVPNLDFLIKIYTKLKSKSEKGESSTCASNIRSVMLIRGNDTLIQHIFVSDLIVVRSTKATPQTFRELVSSFVKDIIGKRQIGFRKDLEITNGIMQFWLPRNDTKPM